ncbi:hypothetical protein HII36_31170 [Nonomuraea sp. NN258]|uniref:hypothetical protein n=1 Tax=Nonomuraea antri TaxID=2730852 RepID=UPI001569999F|nr:hypothetical protein [Nonomuraea antri]NRQ36262.1 hypothetical protein [Nonomuraea antri]
MSSASSALRLSRAVVFATVCGGVSAAGHALAGGGPIPLAGYLLGVACALLLAYLADGRERGLPGVLALTVTAQVALHELFGRLAPAPAAGHGHAATGMALVHLTIAALTAWWLWRGERALWLMISLYGVPPAVIPRLLALGPVDVPVPGVRRAAVLRTRPSRTRVVCGAVGRRGPPAPVG